jgi:hypothetical protein
MGWLKARARLLLLVAAALGGALFVFTREQGAAPAGIDVVEPIPRSVPVTPESASAPRIDLDRLAQRNAKAPERDLFDVRGWRPPAPKAAPPPPAEPQEEPLPPVPYTYLGRWSEPKGEVVLLGREGRSYLARVSDVLDAAYRVDSIEPARIVLTYLPRNAMQVIPITQRTGALNLAAAPQGRTDAADADAVLLLSMPDKAGVGEEITVLANLDPRKVALIERGSAELRYDPAVLNLVRGAPGAGASPDAGRVALDLGGGFFGHGGRIASVRLRVVSAGQGTTQITLADIAATDANARTLFVTVDGPNPRRLTIVGTQK